jgi:hypothetical protein
MNEEIRRILLNAILAGISEGRWEDAGLRRVKSVPSKEDGDDREEAADRADGRLSVKKERNAALQ